MADRKEQRTFEREKWRIALERLVKADEDGDVRLTRAFFHELRTRMAERSQPRL